MDDLLREFLTETDRESRSGRCRAGARSAVRGRRWHRLYDQDSSHPGDRLLAPRRGRRRALRHAAALGARARAGGQWRTSDRADQGHAGVASAQEAVAAHLPQGNAAARRSRQRRLFRRGPSTSRAPPAATRTRARTANRSSPAASTWRPAAVTCASCAAPAVCGSRSATTLPSISASRRWTLCSHRRRQHGAPATSRSCSPAWAPTVPAAPRILSRRAAA